MKTVTETYVSPKSLGEDHRNYKINAIREQYPGAEITFEEGEIPQAGSMSTPFASNYGKTEPGYRIFVKRQVAEPGEVIDRRL